MVRHGQEEPPAEEHPVDRPLLRGSPRGPVTIDLHDEVHTLGLEIIGAHNSTHPPAETPNTPWSITRHVELFLEWTAAGKLSIDPLITHIMPLDYINRAFDLMHSGESIRSVVVY